MKNHFLSLLILLPLTMSSQAPQSFSYQGVARNNSGDLLTNTSITVQLKIHDGSSSGTVVYSEQHSLTTNTYGGFSLTVGQGSGLSGTFSSVNWASGTKFLEQLIDFGTGLQSIGTTQLLSVPYALEAEHANSATTATIATTAVTALNGVPAGTNGQTLRYNGTAWVANSNLFNNGTNIGINNSSPLALLDIKGNVGSPAWYASTTQGGEGSGGLYVQGTGGISDRFNIFKFNEDGNIAQGGVAFNGGINEIYTGTGNPSPMVIGLQADNDLYFMTNNLMRMKIEEDGKIGIGINAPVSRFQLNALAGMNNKLHFTNTTTGTTATDGFEIGVNDASGIARIEQNENAPMVFETNNTERLRIDADGSIGIGTDTPNYLLEIENSDNSDVPMVNLKHTGDRMVGIRLETDWKTWIIGQNNSPGASGSDDFFIHNESDGLDRFMIDGINGNVGIGTTDFTPAAKLEVAGNLKLGLEGTIINNIIKATVNFDVSNIAAGGSLSEVMAVAGASPDATVFVSPDLSLNSGMVIAFARVSSEGNVLVRFTNTTDSAIDLNAMDYHIVVIE